MKEFEKWWFENMPKDMRYESAYHKALLSDGWKAALEWVARKGMHYYGNDFLTDMNELSTDIRIELGHLDEKGYVIKDE